MTRSRTGLEIAVIGMAGRFPGATSLESFWRNIREGVDSLRTFSVQELIDEGIPADLVSRPDYVRTKGVIEDLEDFDAEFFNYTAREAKLLDPQIRLVHECAWEALESAGYGALPQGGRVGLYVGASTDRVWLEKTLFENTVAGAEFTAAGTLAFKDSISTLTSYKLGLRGPSFTLYTACSTSAVAIHLACRALLTGDCELAAAGGVSVYFPKKKGYVYQEGMTSSPDGVVRPFDANAGGAVFSDGAGIVLLKRLEDALEDRDPIRAVILASAINNDGGRNAGYTAPSVEGQADVIRAAHRLAEIDAESITYVETHGTATRMGDTIEFEALKRSFPEGLRAKCAIGSVKANIGHLDTASGVAGFIKAVLALEHKEIPPSIHFDRPNPLIDLVDSPFYVAGELMPWEAAVRRAGVSSFGFGGTNVHIVVEEAPSLEAGRSSAPGGTRIVPLSARSLASLEMARVQLATHLSSIDDERFADTCFTLQIGRKAFEHREAFVCRSRREAIELLSASAARRRHASEGRATKTGGYGLWLGSQDVASRAALVSVCREQLPVLEEAESLCGILEAIDAELARRVRDRLVAHRAHPDPRADACLDLVCTLAAQRALERLGLSFSSIVASGAGHVAAAVVLGVLRVEDGLRWICEGKLRPASLGEAGAPVFSLETSRELSVAETARPEVWMRLAQGEVRDPTQGLAWVAAADPARPLVVMAAAPGSSGAQSGVALWKGSDRGFATSFPDLLARSWVDGGSVEWRLLYEPGSRGRVPLPTYPFQKRRHWVDERAVSARQGHLSQIEKRADVAQWFYVPRWDVRPYDGAVAGEASDARVFVVLLAAGAGRPAIVEAFRQRGEQVIVVPHGSEDDRQAGYARALAEAVATRARVIKVVHMVTLDQDLARERAFDEGIHSAVDLTKALARQDVSQRFELTFVTNDLFRVRSGDRTVPEKWALLAAVKVVPQEHPNVRARCIDVELDELEHDATQASVLRELCGEISGGEIAYRRGHRYVRGHEQLSPERFADVLSRPEGVRAPQLRDGGVYLITGGLGVVGLTLARHLARACRATLILVGRSGLPPREDWEAWKAQHEPDERQTFRIHQIEGLEALGARVEVVVADVADEARMSAAVADVETRNGPIRGVIHAAGVLRVHSAQCPIVGIERDDLAEQLRPKLAGIRVLSRIFSARAPDFCIAVSSLSPILGGLGAVAYAAANLALDGFIAGQEECAPTWIRVGWNDWEYVGARLNQPLVRTAIEDLTMTESEAIKSFECVLALDDRRELVISTGDLAARIDQWIHLRVVEGLGAWSEGESSKPRSRSRLLAAGPADRSEVQGVLIDVCKDFLGADALDLETNLFELGATSLHIIQIHSKVVSALGRHVPIAVFFEHPTLAELGAALAGDPSALPEAQPRIAARERSSDVAIVGLSGRFPGADSIRAFWQNVVDGVCAIRFFDDDELIQAGVSRDEVTHPSYVPAKGYMEGTDLFDAEFFDYTPRDASLMDPQQRVFHEVAWEAFEEAGYNIRTYQGRIGVFAGASPNLLWQAHSMLSERTDPASLFAASILNDKDSLSTQISYKFNLSGPSVTVFTGCSTSLVAIEAAYRSIVAGECDMCIAGGVTISQPTKAGYMYQPGMVYSQDGLCRAFDADASGMVFGDGVGVVVLKALEKAVDDGDSIHAVIRGCSVNNDGHRKVGYTAPSVDGQAEVIRLAHQRAGVSPDSIGYVETHGTGTKLGDTVEVAAMKKAYGNRSPLPIGSVKTQVGHLNAAAGVAGLIKVALMLEHRRIPASLHFSTPNPQCELETGPFFVNTRAREWTQGDTPRRAGVSSFGIGGTNAHAILEEAPCPPPADPGSEWQILLLSAKTPQALERATDNLALCLETNPDMVLPDVAYTLQLGRVAFKHRRSLVCRSVAEASHALSTRSRALRTSEWADARSVVLMFPGNGAEYLGMGRELYEREPAFRSQMQDCFRILEELLGRDPRPLIYPSGAELSPESDATLRNLRFNQPLIFCVEYALATALGSWGIRPSALIGYSLGEFAAACLAGIFSLEDALRIVVARGQLLSELPAGAMLSVPLRRELLDGVLAHFERQHPELSVGVAIDNGGACVVSGSHAAIDRFEKQLRSERILSMRLKTTVAAHSLQTATVAADFRRVLEDVVLRPPEIPVLSGTTGTWLTPEQALSVDYWSAHLHQTIQFAAGISLLGASAKRVFVEVGPGRDLSVLAQRIDEARDHVSLWTLSPPGDDRSEVQHLKEKLAQLWRLGVPVDWREVHGSERRRRVSLPTYPFEKVQHGEMGNAFDLTQRAVGAKRGGIEKDPDLARWFYVRGWRTEPLQTAVEVRRGRKWLLLGDELEIVDRLHDRLRQEGDEVALVGSKLDAASRAGWGTLLQALDAADRFPDAIVHCLSLTGHGSAQLPEETVLERGLYSVFDLLQALVDVRKSRPLDLYVVTSGSQNVLGDEALVPGNAAILGATLVASQELPGIRCSLVDIPSELASGHHVERSCEQILRECRAAAPAGVVAFRGGQRWRPTYQPQPLHRSDASAKAPLRARGVYVLTGAFGGIGRILSEHLAKEYGAKLVLVSRGSTAEETSASPRLRFVEKLVALGAEVAVETASVADRAAMQGVIRRTRERFGCVHGVIHAAGLPSGGTFKLLPQLERRDLDEQLEAKMRGVQVLEEVLREEPIDFCLLMSSISTVLGGLGFTGYAAANLYMDAFASGRNRGSSIRWYCVNWSDWRYSDEPGNESGGLGSSVRALSIEPQEGIECFERILASGQVEILHSPGNLAARVEQWAGSARAEEEQPQTGPRLPRPELSAAFVEASDSLERELAQILAEIFRIDLVGTGDDFFELGGDSLKGVATVTRIYKRLGVEIPLTQLFETPTIAGLATFIRAAEHASSFREIPATEAKPFYRLSPAQKRIYVLHELFPNSTAYNDAMAYAIEGQLDAERVERAFKALIVRHESLRTSFEIREREPVQRVHASAELALEHLHVSEAELGRRATQLVKPFDLTRAPLMRVVWYELHPRRHVIAIDLHHIVTDGASYDCLVRDFIALYRGDVLPPLRLQYKDYSEWQYSEEALAAKREHAPYWLKKLADRPRPTQLPPDFATPVISSFVGGTVRCSLGGSTTTDLRAFARSQGVTVFHALLAAFKILLHRHTGERDLIVGTPVAGRFHPDLEGIVGIFVNMLPVRTSLDDSMTFREYLARVRAATVEAVEHERYPYEDLIRELHLAGQLEKSPLFSTVVVQQYVDAEERRFDDLVVRRYDLDLPRAIFDLLLIFLESDEEVRLVCEFSTDLYEQRRIVGAMEELCALVGQVLAEPDAPIRMVGRSRTFGETERRDANIGERDFAF